MRLSRIYIPFFIATLLLATLACGLPSDSLLENKPAPLETAEEAARVGAIAAKEAAARAGDLAGTAAVVATTEGSQVMSTAKAVAAPHADYLKEKLVSIEPDEEGNYRVTFTEDEVNTVLRLRQLLSGDIIGASIQSQQVTFQNGRITLSGTIMEPLPGELLVVMQPVVTDGDLKLTPVNAALAGKEAPAEALAAAESALNSSLGEALEHLPGGVELLDILAENGELIITGRRIDVAE